MKTRIGLAGLGYWGPNLARNFAAIEDCELRWCCDALPERAGKAPPGTRVDGRGVKGGPEGALRLLHGPLAFTTSVVGRNFERSSLRNSHSCGTYEIALAAKHQPMPA